MRLALFQTPALLLVCQCMHSIVNGGHIRPGVLFQFRVNKIQSLTEHIARVHVLSMEASCQPLMLLITIIIKTCLSQEASGTCDASQLPPDRLVSSITGVVV